MKNIYILLLALFILNIADAQPVTGHLYGVVNGSNVILKLDTASRNCGAEYVQYFVLNPHTCQIDWYQIDTGQIFGCSCWFNYSIKIDSLPVGWYTANNYYTYPIGNDTVFNGSTTFLIDSSAVNKPVQINDSSSLCFSVESIKEKRMREEFPYPDPVENYIYYPKAFAILDLMGKELGRSNDLRFDMSMVNPGIYFLKSQNKIFKIIKQ
jgi:hypothetical protein